MSDLVNGLLLSESTRTRLVEIARKFDAGKLALQRAYVAGEISPAELKRRAAALMAEIRALSAPITREVDAALALAHREFQGVKHGDSDSIH